MLLRNFNFYFNYICLNIILSLLFNLEKSDFLLNKLILNLNVPLGVLENSCASGLQWMPALTQILYLLSMVAISSIATPFTIQEIIEMQSPSLRLKNM